MAIEYEENVSTIGLPEQRLWMEELHPQFACDIEHRPTGAFLVCKGEVQPTPINERYGLRIEYQTRKAPTTRVEYPEIKPLVEGGHIEHTYRDGSLCLYRNDFRSDMLIAQTIVPWALLWLFFYESWRATGVWQGGGTHPPARARPRLPADQQRNR
jgi:hypothetical protein